MLYSKRIKQVITLPSFTQFSYDKCLGNRLQLSNNILSKKSNSSHAFYNELL